MKKLIYCVAVLWTLIIPASCAKKWLADATVNVTFTIATPRTIQSKVNTDGNGESTIANGHNIDSLFYEIYAKDNFDKLLGEGRTKTEEALTDGSKTFKLTLKLVLDQPYSILFWAHADGGYKYYDVTDLTQVKIRDNYSDFDANDESRAAFHARCDFNADGTPQSVEMTRPFAQLNLGTSTMESSLMGDIEVKTTKVEVSNVANVFDVSERVGRLELEGADELSVEFNATATPHGSIDNTQKLLKVKTEEYHWLGMNYIVIEGARDVASTVDVTIETNAGIVTHTINNVPFGQNYRTNLIGNFLISDVTFNIIVDKLFESDRDNTTEEDFIWDNDKQTWN